MTNQKTKTVCAFGYSEADEGGRAWAILTGLAENDITVTPCRTLVPGYLAKLKDLHQQWQRIKNDVDAIYVVFMGYYLMPLAWYLARRQGIPVVLDALVSQHDTEVTDRKRLSWAHPRAWFLWILDWFSCHAADAIVVDTETHKKFFSERFHIHPDKIIVMRVGCRSDLFIPMANAVEKNDDFTVEFHGAFSPLQGVEYIVEAAKILQEKGERVRFLITGAGQLSGPIKALIGRYKLANVELHVRRPLADLPGLIAQGDVCLGIFGTTGKALRVIPHKVYECMSCGKPVITERSPAALEVLHDGEDVCLVEPGNGRALAEKILELKNDVRLRARLGDNALAISLREFSPSALVKPLIQWLNAHI